MAELTIIAKSLGSELLGELESRLRLPLSYDDGGWSVVHGNAEEDQV